MTVASSLSITPDSISDSGRDQPGGASTRGSHRLAAAISCERLWWLRYGLGYRGIHEPPYRLIGTLVHLILAYWYAEKMDEPPEWLYESSLDDQLEKEGEGHPDQIRTAVDVANYYKQQRVGEIWHPIAVEKEFAASLGELDPGGQPSTLDDEAVTCRVDLMVEANGEIFVVDHKTQGGSWRKDGRLEKWKDDGDYLLNWQVLANLHILRKRLDRPIGGFVINRIKRTAPYDEDAHVLRVPQRAYSQAPRTMRAMVARERWIHARATHGIQPIPNFAACYGRYGPCDYRDVCAADTLDQATEILKRQFRR